MINFTHFSLIDLFEDEVYLNCWLEERRATYHQYHHQISEPELAVSFELVIAWKRNMHDFWPLALWSCIIMPDTFMHFNIFILNVVNDQDSYKYFFFSILNCILDLLHWLLHQKQWKLQFWEIVFKVWFPRITQVNQWLISVTICGKIRQIRLYFSPYLSFHSNSRTLYMYS